MQTVVPSQKVIDIALFVQYLRQLKKLPRTSNSLFSRISSVYEKLKTLNNVETDPAEYSLPFEEKELYLQRCEGVLNGDIVTREWDGPTHLYIRNGTNEIDVVQELIATYPAFRPHLATSYYGNAFVHPDGVIVRLVAYKSATPDPYAKGLLVFLDEDLVLDSVVETWETSTHWKTLSDSFMNTVAVMSIEGDSVWCINRDTSKNTNVFSTMEFNVVNKTTKHYDDIRWTHSAVNYKLANGVLYKGSAKYAFFFDPTEICNRRIINSSAQSKHYLGYPFQIGFDGNYVYWNTTRLSVPSGWGSYIPSLANYQYVKRFKVVE